MCRWWHWRLCLSSSWSVVAGKPGLPAAVLRWLHSWPGWLLSPSLPTGWYYTCTTIHDETVQLYVCSVPIVNTHVHTDTCTNTYTCTCMHTYTYTRMQTHTHTTHIYTHTHYTLYLICTPCVQWHMSFLRSKLFNRKELIMRNIWNTKYTKQQLQWIMIRSDGVHTCLKSWPITEGSR